MTASSLKLTYSAPNRFAKVPKISALNLDSGNPMPALTIRQLSFLFALAITICSLGCAEGPFWRAGKMTPWAQKQWAAEEQIADSLFARKRKMTESVDAAIGGPLEDQQRVAQELAEVLYRDHVLLLRIHSVKLLGQLDCPAAVKALVDASQDHTSDIRIEAIKAWGNLPPDTAIPHLQQMIGSDTDIDVRLAATRTLGNFSGQKAVSAIALALDDRNPALQLRAAESLGRVTGEQFGRDISAWQQYVQNTTPDQMRPNDLPSLPEGNSGVAENLLNTNTDSIFR
jgi:hypothetical protein